MHRELKREKFIVYGDCQAYALIRVLNCIREVAERFDLRFHAIDQQVANWMRWRDEIMEASYILVQDVESLDEYPFTLLTTDLRPPSALFPRVAFAALWPFSTEFGGEDRGAEQLHADLNTTDARYFDALLGLLRYMPDKNSRYQTYLNLEHNDNAEIRKFLARRDIPRIFELECMRLRKMDGRYGLTVGDYIIANFRRARLFYTVKHPAVGLTYIMAVQLLGKLGLGSELSRPLLDNMDYYQIPVHPVIAKTLDVDWAKPDMAYNVLGEKMTFEEYAKRYIEDFG